MHITYGSVIKLMHEKTKFRLHSHDVPYGSGSGQQSVTGFPSVDDSNSYWVNILIPIDRVEMLILVPRIWSSVSSLDFRYVFIILLQIVRPQPGTSAKQGDTIKSGTIIRLQHMRTRKWLHSHLHASPISGNLEVSAIF